MRNKISGKQLIAALISGLLLLAASPGFAGLSPLAWLALVPLLYAISDRDTSPLTGALLGLICGLAYYPALISWITVVLGKYGGLPLWLSIPALLLLASYMSLYLAGFAALCCHLQKRYPLIWVAPITWVAMDFLRGWLFTGFPWFDLAYTQFKHPLLIQIADLTGHHGVSFMLVMGNGLILHAFYIYRKKQAFRFRSEFAFTSALFLVLALLSYNPLRFQIVKKELSGQESFGVAVVQGNIEQGQKWRPELQRRTLDKYIKMSRRIMASAEPKLLVWPETALPFYLAESPLLEDIVALAASRRDLTILTGAPYRERSPASPVTRYFNSAFFIDSGGIRAARYDKQHLVPFGEYVPLKRLLPFLAPLVETVADFTPGRGPKPITCQNIRVGVLICFESIFPELARKQTAAGSELLVNLTNDAWYGRTGAPWQHLSMAVFRAVENRRSLTRAANTGVSGFIDPLGRMHGLSPIFEDYIAYDDLPITGMKSVFTYYGGHLAGIICLAITGLMVILTYRKK
ncbi:MAG: apolipoprotein N-acyltransferase [Desulfurivibrionaceae bacterium]